MPETLQDIINLCELLTDKGQSKVKEFALITVKAEFEKQDKEDIKDNETTI